MGFGSFLCEKFKRKKRQPETRSVHTQTDDDTTQRRSVHTQTDDSITQRRSVHTQTDDNKSSQKSPTSITSSRVPQPRTHTDKGKGILIERPRSRQSSTRKGIVIEEGKGKQKHISDTESDINSIRSGPSQYNNPRNVSDAENPPFKYGYPNYAHTPNNHYPYNDPISIPYNNNPQQDVAYAPYNYNPQQGYYNPTPTYPPSHYYSHQNYFPHLTEIPEDKKWWFDLCNSIFN